MQILKALLHFPVRPFKQEILHACAKNNFTYRWSGDR